ncbi:MAG: endonuclease [Nanoarchaeota archaeon]
MIEFFSDERYNNLHELTEKINNKLKDCNLNFEDFKNYSIKKFNFLLKKFGYQNWWPTFYKEKEKKMIEIIIGAILTQNTSWKQVEKSLFNLRSNNLISFSLIEEINKNRDKIVELIRSSGFARRKVETIKETLLWFKNNKEKIKTMKIRDLRKELLKIKGIGKETADSIILYALEKPIFVVDNYTKRTLKRDLGIEIKNYDLLRILFELSFYNKKAKDKIKLFKEFHALIVEENKQFKQ